MAGEEASDELELGKREWARAEKIGDVGEEGRSEDDVDDCERSRAWLAVPESEESIAKYSSSFFLAASTICGNRSAFNSRISRSVGLLMFALISKTGNHRCERWRYVVLPGRYVAGLKPMGVESSRIKC